MTKLSLVPKCLCRVYPTLLLACIPLLGQYSKQAEVAISGPFKVAVKAPPQGARAGEPIDFTIMYLNGRDQPTPMSKDSNVEIHLVGSSSNDIVRRTTCRIQARVAVAKCPVQAPKSGLYKVRAVPGERELLEGSAYVLVIAAHKSAVPRFREDAPQRSPFITAAYYPEPQPDPSSEPRPASPASAAASCGATKTHGSAKVVLTINEGGEDGGAFRSRLESATIQAFFQADDGGTAPTDILVWLSPNHGTLDRQPLVIPKCSITGEAHLSSRFPVQTTIKYSVAPASYSVEAPPTLQATFVRPIVGIRAIPPGTHTLSLIDSAPIVAQFYDADGAPITTDSERTVTFASGNAVFSPRQQTVKLKPGDSSAATVILPFWLGKGSLSITADRLQPALHSIEVVGKIVIAVCLIGGLAGGLVLFLAAGGSIYSRLTIGVVAGIVLCWAYVFGVLPKVDGIVAHNYVTVFVVSILGGYLGIKTFDLVLKKLGWATA